MFPGDHPEFGRLSLSCPATFLIVEMGASQVRAASLGLLDTRVPLPSLPLLRQGQVLGSVTGDRVGLAKLNRWRVFLVFIFTVTVSSK